MTKVILFAQEIITIDLHYLIPSETHRLAGGSDISPSHIQINGGIPNFPALQQIQRSGLSREPPQETFS